MNNKTKRSARRIAPGLRGASTLDGGYHPINLHSTEQRIFSRIPAANWMNAGAATAVMGFSLLGRQIPAAPATSDVIYAVPPIAHENTSMAAPALLAEVNGILNPQIKAGEYVMPSYSVPSVDVPRSTIIPQQFQLMFNALPADVHPRLFMDFGEAVEAKDIDFLARTMEGWNDVASLYARDYAKDAIANSEGFNIVHERLVSLLQPEDEGEEDEEDIPSGFAFSHTLDLLFETYKQLPKEFPRGLVSTSYRSGIRIEWVKGIRKVRLVTSALPDGNSYLYHEENNETKIDPNPNSAQLAQQLVWMLEESNNEV